LNRHNSLTLYAWCFPLGVPHQLLWHLAGTANGETGPSKLDENPAKRLRANSPIQATSTVAPVLPDALFRAIRLKLMSGTQLREVARMVQRNEKQIAAIAAAARDLDLPDSRFTVRHAR
jgi:hypothetical protein